MTKTCRNRRNPKFGFMKNFQYRINLKPFFLISQFRIIHLLSYAWIWVKKHQERTAHPFICTLPARIKPTDNRWKFPNITSVFLAAYFVHFTPYVWKLINLPIHPRHKPQPHNYWSKKVILHVSLENYHPPNWKLVHIYHTCKIFLQVLITEPQIYYCKY